MSKKLIRLNATAVCCLLKAFQEGPCTTKELAEQSGLHMTTVRRYVREMRKFELAHISAWEGRWPVYAFSAGRDKRRPVTPRSIIEARYRQRRARRMAPSPWNV